MKQKRKNKKKKDIIAVVVITIMKKNTVAVVVKKDMSVIVMKKGMNVNVVKSAVAMNMIASVKNNSRHVSLLFFTLTFKTDIYVGLLTLSLKKVDNNENLQLTDGSVVKAKEVYLKLLDSISKSGEPGIIFSNNKNFICDSCAASELNANEGLNLAQVNLSRFYNSKTKKIDYDFLSQSANVLSLALKKIAPNGFISILGYQDLLNQMEINYGSKEALNVLENCLKTIKLQADSNNIRMAISPSGLTSRLLKTTPSIEPFNNPDSTYWDEIETMATAQKYLDGGISKTITLKQHHTIQDIDLIIRHCQSKNIKGISLFPYDKISHTKL